MSFTVSNIRRSLTRTTIAIAAVTLLMSTWFVSPAAAQLTKTGTINCGTLATELYALADGVIEFSYPARSSGVRRTVNHGSAYYTEVVRTGYRGPVSWRITGYGVIDNNATGARCYRL